MKNFWNDLPKPFFCLAPMESVTDLAFRQVVAKAARPDVFFTEFTNVSGFAHPLGKSSVERRLRVSPSDAPIVAQIWGTDLADFAQTAAAISQSGDFAGIDINMGCPDKAVVKSGAGSALIKNPKLAKEIIEAVRSVTASNFPDAIASEAKQSRRHLTGLLRRLKPPRNDSLPVSVKTRLGYSSVDEWRDWLTVLLEQNLDALTVCLRTKKEMSKVPAHHELIPSIVKLRATIAPKTKLVINGDIKSTEWGLTPEMKKCGVDGFMIGRGIFANPFCFERTPPQQHTSQELLNLLKFHLSLFDENGQKYEPMKRFFKIYINDFAGAKELRAQLMETTSPDQAIEILRNL
jgi:tRNA-dihydrouridine synthase